MNTISKKDIKDIAKALKAANDAQASAEYMAEKLQMTIIRVTGVKGFIDYLPGDGFGFTPECNNDTHISMEHLFELLNSGHVTEEDILNRLTL